MAAIAIVGAGRDPAAHEDVHDVTTSIETDVPQTATRVFVLYKVNNALRARSRSARPGARLSLRRAGESGAAVHAVLGAARWEVLVGLRNLFRDPNDAGSIYDELLVVRPPKRVIGGVLIRF